MPGQKHGGPVHANVPAFSAGLRVTCRRHDTDAARRSRALAATAPAFGRGSPISFALSNTSGRTVLVAACGDHVTVILERSQGAGWQNYASGICLAIYFMVPATLAPGALREETTTVQDPGRYRLRILVGTDLRNVNLGVVSPPFDVR